MTLHAKPHLLHVFPGFGIGGMQLRTVRVMSHLGTKCQHTVIALDGITTAAEQVAAEVAIDIRTMPVNKRRSFGNLVTFRRVLAAVRPDLLATYNWGAIEWAGINRIWPLCRHVHFETGFGREEANAQFHRRILARRMVLANSDRIVVPSRTLERIALDVWRLRPDRVRYIPDGIDLARFAVRRRSSIETGHPGERVTIGTVAPLRPEKNIARLIEAFALIADDERLHLTIAGDGSERMALESLAVSRGLQHRITFLGHVARPEEVLPSFDVFALSSDTEQLPNAMLEAMATGLPIAAADVGDVRIVVAPENRNYIVGRDDLDALAKSIRQLAGDPSLRLKLGAENRLRVEQQFAQEQMFTEYEALLLTGQRS